MEGRQKKMSTNSKIIQPSNLSTPYPNLKKFQEFSKCFAYFCFLSSFCGFLQYLDPLEIRHSLSSMIPVINHKNNSIIKICIIKNEITVVYMKIYLALLSLQSFIDQKVNYNVHINTSISEQILR